MYAHDLQVCMIEYIYKQRALMLAFEPEIWQKYKVTEGHGVAKNYSAVDLAAMFKNEIIPNLSNYECIQLDPVLRSYMEQNQDVVHTPIYVETENPQQSSKRGSVQMPEVSLGRLSDIIDNLRTSSSQNRPDTTHWLSRDISFANIMHSTSINRRGTLETSNITSQPSLATVNLSTSEAESRRDTNITQVPRRSYALPEYTPVELEPDYWNKQWLRANAGPNVDLTQIPIPDGADPTRISPILRNITRSSISLDNWGMNTSPDIDKRVLKALLGVPSRVPRATPTSRGVSATRAAPRSSRVIRTRIEQLLRTAATRRFGITAKTSSTSAGASSTLARTSLPPAGDSLPPAGDSLPPAGDSLPPAGDSLPPAGDSLPPARDSLPPAGDSLPPAGDSLPPAAASSTQSEAEY